MGAESDQLARQRIFQEVKKRYGNVPLDAPPPASGEQGWPTLDDGSAAMRWNDDLPLSHSDNIEQSRKVIVGEAYDGLTVGIILAEIFGRHQKGRQEPKSPLKLAQPIAEPAPEVAHEFAAHEAAQESAHEAAHAQVGERIHAEPTDFSDESKSMNGEEAGLEDEDEDEDEDEGDEDEAEADEEERQQPLECRKCGHPIHMGDVTYNIRRHECTITPAEVIRQKALTGRIALHGPGFHLVAADNDTFHKASISVRQPTEPMLISALQTRIGM